MSITSVLWLKDQVSIATSGAADRLVGCITLQIYYQVFIFEPFSCADCF